MTKKHFIKAAKIIRARLEADKLCSPRAQAMADLIIAINDDPNFDKGRFLNACGLN
jgi:hypothetical protein